MIDLYPNIYATLKASDYFVTTLSNFLDSESRFKVFLDGQAPTDETPFVVVDIAPGGQGRNNDWSRPFVTFTAYGAETDRRLLWSIVRNIHAVFEALGAFVAVQNTFTAAVSDVCTGAQHQLENGDIVTLTTAGTLPAGLSLATNYYVVQRTLDTFKLSLTSGGSAVNITTTGTGVHTVVRTAVPYALIGEAIYDEGQNPVTDHVTASVALRFGVVQ